MAKNRFRKPLKNLLMMTLATCLPAATLAQDRNPHDTIPIGFHGQWATTLSDCNEVSMITIGEGRIEGYESDNKLLIASSVIHFSSPRGLNAQTVNLFVVSTVEGEVYQGRLRLTRSGDLLYMTNPELVSESEQWAYSNVRCPHPQ